MRISDEELDKLKQSEAVNDWITAALVDDLQSARAKLEAAEATKRIYATAFTKIDIRWSRLIDVYRKSKDNAELAEAVRNFIEDRESECFSAAALGPAEGGTNA